jgi:hypothetical protein
VHDSVSWHGAQPTSPSPENPGVHMHLLVSSRDPLEQGVKVAFDLHDKAEEYLQEMHVFELVEK